MTAAFKPKFVDLVRNYTSTMGTDDFVLGPAVNGYADFNAECEIGDTFHYSAVGVDNPGETEIGRGTLLDGGVIGRDPIGGTKTNFTSGTTSVALVAAAEWLRDIELIRSSHVNVKSFGAKGDGVISPDDEVSGTDDTAAIQAAIDHVDSLGGGTLYFPPGKYLITSYLRLCKNIRVVGSGRTGSSILTVMTGGGGATPAEDLRNGSAFYSYWDNGPPISSNSVHITIEHMGFLCWNASNVGAAFYDSNGTNIQFMHCRFNGFKYGVVLDYSELVDIAFCDFEPQNDGGASLWIVNGPTLDPAHTAVCATNRISASRCQFNQYNLAYGILDDGGYAHSFVDNNYNGCSSQIYAAGVQGLQVIGGESEGASAPAIELTYLTATDGRAVGGTTGRIAGMMHLTADQPCIHITAVSGPITVEGCLLIRNDKQVPITGANNAGAGLTLLGNYTNSASGELVDGYACGYLFDDRIGLAVMTNFNQANLPLTKQYCGKLVRCTNPTGNACTIQSDSAATLPIGTTFTLEQSANGPVSLIADTGVTLTGPTVTNAKYQRVVARKIAANSWQTELLVQNPLTAGTTPASVTATGAILTTAGGVGYTTGAGGTVTQTTDKSTAVTLNKLSGQITMSVAALAGGAAVQFICSNNQATAGDVVIANHVTGGTYGAYLVQGRINAGGSIVFNVRNLSGATLTETPVIGFAIVKAVTA